MGDAGKGACPHDTLIKLSLRTELHRANVGGFGTFFALADLEGDLLAFAKGAFGSTDVGDVDEVIIAAAVGGDKTKTFGLIEKLNGACRHVHTLLMWLLSWK